MDLDPTIIATLLVLLGKLGRAALSYGMTLENVLGLGLNVRQAFGYLTGKDGQKDLRMAIHFLTLALQDLHLVLTEMKSLLQRTAHELPELKALLEEVVALLKQLVEHMEEHYPRGPAVAQLRQLVQVLDDEGR
jgi:hypothetical protein